MSDSADVLSRAIILHVMDLIETGNRKRLEEMGFNSNHIVKIVELRSREIGHLSARQVNMFEIRVNRNVLDVCLTDIERQRLIDECILAGAPNAFLYQFFGLRSRECSIRRLSLEVDSKVEKRVPSDEGEEALIIKHYRFALGERPEEEFDAQDFLNLHRTIAKAYKPLSLKVIWVAVSRYRQDAFIHHAQVKHHKAGALA